MTFNTASAEETQKIARELLKNIAPSQSGAVILAMEGDLGAGKTTFIQALGRALGVKGKVLSPTFVIIKHFNILTFKHFSDFYHFDCYRLEDPKEILALGFEEIIKDPKNLVAIEWAEKIKKILPKDAIWLKFKHLGEDKRKIRISNI